MTTRAPAVIWAMPERKRFFFIDVFPKTGGRRRGRPGGVVGVVYKKYAQVQDITVLELFSALRLCLSWNIVTIIYSFLTRNQRIYCKNSGFGVTPLTSSTVHWHTQLQRRRSSKFTMAFRFSVGNRNEASAFPFSAFALLTDIGTRWLHWRGEQ